MKMTDAIDFHQNYLNIFKKEIWLQLQIDWESKHEQSMNNYGLRAYKFCLNTIYYVDIG